MQTPSGWATFLLAVRRIHWKVRQQVPPTPNRQACTNCVPALTASSTYPLLRKAPPAKQQVTFASGAESSTESEKQWTIWGEANASQRIESIWILTGGNAIASQKTSCHRLKYGKSYNGYDFGSTSHRGTVPAKELNQQGWERESTTTSVTY